MAEYLFASQDGTIVAEEYDGNAYFSADQVKTNLESAFAQFSIPASIESVDNYEDVFHVVYPSEDIFPEIYICAKGTTPGGRSGLTDEQRIQPKAKHLNYVYNKGQEGKKAVNLGIYKRDGQMVFCAWRVSFSNAASQETPISKQIKITSIAKAIKEGFVQQDKGRGEFACAFKPEFLYFYLRNCEWLHGQPVSEYAQNADHEDIMEEPLNSATERAKFGANKIFYGAPGCGKSRHVSDMLKEASVAKDNIIRVTFHPEYANCDFIGQILPTVETRTDEATGAEKEIVKYIFNPGPFTLALQTAYDTNDMVFLIVEEINRGNAAAIFGDMFQLLDRVKDSGKPNYCASEYPVSNPNMQKYLIESISDEAIKAELQNGVFIPSNLTIYATMNSSDQNVFTLDTAFKRRWSFEQISNDINKDTGHAYKTWYLPGTEVTWADFLTKLNDKILDYKLQNQTNEDKRLGKYFVTKDCLVDPADIPGDVSEIAQNFAYKVLEYVWNDVCKIGREEWFDTETYKTLEDLIEAFINPKEGDTPLSVFQNITF